MKSPPLFLLPLLLSTAAAQLQYGQPAPPPPSPSSGSSSDALSTVVTFMSEIYTIPLFNPSLAPTFGASKTTLYRPTDLPLPSSSSSSSSTAPTSSPNAQVPSRTKVSSETLGTLATVSFTTTTGTAIASASPSIPPAPATVEQLGSAAPRSHADLTSKVFWGALAGLAGRLVV